MRILIVENDNETAAAMRLMLVGENWIAHRCSTGAEAISLIRHLTLDAVTLDLGLPDMSGLDVLRALRTTSRKIPIICCSGLSEVEIRVAALRAGAADYIVKPFHRDELMGRIHSVVRRHNGRADNIVEIAAWKIDTAEGTVFFDGVEIKLSVREKQFLMRLAMRPGEVVTGIDLFANAYEDGEEPDGRAISVFLFKLRSKFIEASGGDPLIECIWSRGYRLSNKAKIHRTRNQPHADWFERLGMDTPSGETASL